MSTTLKQYISYITKHGLARNNRFEVLIPLPDKLIDAMKEGQEEDEEKRSKRWTDSKVFKTIRTFMGGSGEVTRGLALMVEDTFVPSKSLTTTDVRYNGDFYRIPFANTYDNHEFIFRVSRDFYEKDIIDKWMKFIFDPVSHNVQYYDDFTTNITINVLNNQDQVVYSVMLIDAFPMTCSPMQLSNNAQNDYMRLITMFAYRRWLTTEEYKDTKGGIADSLSQTPLGPIITPILSNPAVQAALQVIEDNTGIDLDGEAANIYNQIDAIVRGATGSSPNKIASLLNGIKAQIALNDKLSVAQIGQLIELINKATGKLGGNP